MIKAGIIGANGYTGFELMRLLAAHPEAEVTFAASRSLAGHKVRETYPTLAGYYGDTEYSEPDIAEAASCSPACRTDRAPRYADGSSTPERA